jgi:hypothetical protein
VNAGRQARRSRCVRLPRQSCCNAIQGTAHSTRSWRGMPLASPYLRTVGGQFQPASPMRDEHAALG